MKAKFPALTAILTGNFNVTPLDGCDNCPFGTPSNERDRLIPEPNPMDPEEGDYDCSLLKKQRIWGESPKCDSNAWKQAALAELAQAEEAPGDMEEVDRKTSTQEDRVIDLDLIIKSAAEFLSRFDCESISFNTSAQNCPAKHPTFKLSGPIRLISNNTMMEFKGQCKACGFTARFVHTSGLTRMAPGTTSGEADCGSYLCGSPAGISKEWCDYHLINPSTRVIPEELPVMPPSMLDAGDNAQQNSSMEGQAITNDMMALVIRCCEWVAETSPLKYEICTALNLSPDLASNLRREVMRRAEATAIALNKGVQIPAWTTEELTFLRVLCRVTYAGHLSVDQVKAGRLTELTASLLMTYDITFRILHHYYSCLRNFANQNTQA
jgi:hypothetical protein